jgi:hypothetical protein
MPSDAYGPIGQHRDSEHDDMQHNLESDCRPTMAPPPMDVSDGSPPGQVEIQQIRLAQHFVMVFCTSNSLYYDQELTSSLPS